MRELTKRVVIVGGGAAGWLTAGILAAKHGKIGNGADVSITLIESPDVPTIGVGEGTWPTMRETLSTMGVSESKFITACDVSFKQGSQFINWRNNCEGDNYYHPFSIPNRYFEMDLADLWNSTGRQTDFAYFAGSQAVLCDEGLAPKQKITPEFAAVVNYGYHLDAGKFGEFLKQHCTQVLGVEYIQDHVISVDGERDTNIIAINTRVNGAINGDFFIDCTGSNSLLIGGHYSVPLITKEKVLFNDRALAVQVPRQVENQAIASCTRSTAQKYGWIWDIGLPTRQGIGYVYSSRYGTKEEIYTGLVDYISKSCGVESVDDLNIRELEFTPGVRSEFWVKNCVAVGMSSGFIEPLEASALAIVELAAKKIRDDFPYTASQMESICRRYNESFHYKWDRVIDFIKLHYVLSDRRDSEYWLANTESVKECPRLEELLDKWKYRSPNKHDFPEVDEVFPAASYLYILSGTCFERYSDPHKNEKLRSAAMALVEENKAQVKKLLNGLPTNKELLESIAAVGLPKKQ
ncbi:tryptophan 7-halogenase [Saccharophagus degradans]|uniref:tryptophan halogenase family protein n=1 Tax=Saccharophagus degradans TaxID=86304 RepID=UPI001C08F5D9|nr:tryptophan halogenase family protein [Saccharophagus degradans]MBU2986048.1 tryptophan 7-halogenase [Saccharophagus degradans]